MGCAQSTPEKGASGGVSTMERLGQQSEAAAAAALCSGVPEFTSQVELSISARHLPDKDLTSKSDPLAVLYQSATSSNKSGQWLELGRTDVLCNTQDPTFTRTLLVRYTFEQLQPMRLVIFDADTSAKRPEDLDLAQQDYLAEVEFLFSDLMTAPSQHLTLPLRSSKGGRVPDGCSVTLNAEELANTNAGVRLAFSATGLENKDRFSKSDPFLRVSKLRESGEWVPVFKTEVIDNNLNPSWRPFEVDIRQLCNADEHRPLRLEVFDYDSTGSHDLIGAAETTLGALRAGTTRMLDLVNPKKAGQGSYRHSGVLEVRDTAVIPRPSFLQYIAGGLQLSMMVAIDFTGSNGDPRSPTSLHYLSAAPTIYEQAIMAVGRVLECYDADKNFPVWGFGAALPPNGAVSHCFSLGGTPDMPEAHGIQGILAAYRNCLPTVKLSGPTMFAPIIQTAASIAAQAAAGPRLAYHVLLILTDGCIMDMNATKEAIVQASGLPLSLLIVGVGDADFSAMEALDSDKKALRAGGHSSKRDIVQFVPLSRTQHKGGAEGVARELLAEIPGQVVDYFNRLRKIPPPPPMPAAGTGPVPVM